MQENLFILLRLGLRTRNPKEENVSTLLALTEPQWENLVEVAKSQGVAGVAFDGISILIETYGRDYFNHFENRSFWRRFIVKWAMTVEQSYEARNRKQIQVIDDVQKRWGEAGIRMMIMKGQAMGTYYPVPKHRCPGDIDCYLFEDYTRGNELSKAFADSVDEGWYKHSQIHYRDELIENHQFFVHTREGFKSKRLENVIIATLKDATFNCLPETQAVLPPPMFNALFLAYHTLTHFLEEGMRLKQIMDWAVFLRQDENNVNWFEFYQICELYHIRRFAEILTDIAVHKLGVEIDNPQIISESPLTERVLFSTLNDKDFVFSSGEGGWKNRWHIVTNLFKYRWKYHQVYRHSIIRQLWFYASGYLLKTE